VDDIMIRLADKKTRILCAATASILLLFVLSTVYILHHLSGRLTEMKNHVAGIEKKTVDLERKQIEDRGHLVQLDRKFTVLSNSPALKEVETLPQRVNLLEKQMESIHVRQKITTVRSKPVHQKQYYEVKEGDTLYRVSRKYGLTIDELLQMNHLDEDDGLTAGQRLVVSR